MFLTIFFVITKYFAIAFIILLIAARLFFKSFTRFNKSNICLKGKTAIVTGANTGIGYFTALDFARRGARVILACRDESKANLAKNRIIDETGNDDIHIRLIDLNDLQSVRDFGAEINRSEERLDILVNNAGATGLGNKRTKDDLQMIMQINFYAAFLLTHLLIGKLKVHGGRIVNVASIAANMAKVRNADKLNNYLCEYPQWLSDIIVYSKSKICLILFSRLLAIRLAGSGVKVYSLHPGAIKTDIWRTIPKRVQWFVGVCMDFAFRNCEEGAQTTIYCAVSKECAEHTGLYYNNCQVVDFYESCADMRMAKRIWDKTEELVQMTEEERMK